MNQKPEWIPPTDHPTSHSPLRRRKIFKDFLYFMGVFLAAFGLTGIMVEVNFTTVGGCIAICLGLGFLLAGIIVFSRTYRFLQDLTWLQYLAWILGATIIVCIVFLLVIIIYKSDKYLAGMFFYGIFLLYGFTFIWLAYKKPSLSQQVSESVQNILEAMPSKQISVSELIAHLQKKLHLPDIDLYQYIVQLKYIEQLDVPGTNTKIVLMRKRKQQLVFPQVATITNSILRANIERALLDLTEERVDIGLFLLGREFETVLKAFLIKAHAKGQLPITPGNKDPDQMKLIEMISCLKSNKIVTDEAALSYLRQQRNDRAHGGTPTPAESSLLMKNAQLLAGLYIDYIKWFDELMHTL